MGVNLRVLSLGLLGVGSCRGVVGRRGVVFNGDTMVMLFKTSRAKAWKIIAELLEPRPTDEILILT